MKVTNRLTHIKTDVQFEAAMTEDQLKAKFAEKGLAGFDAMLDIAERTEEHVQMMSLDDLLEFAKVSGAAAVTYDVTYFPHADEGEVERQLRALGNDLDISPDVIRSVCADEIKEYLALDAKRNADAPVHSIVEAYIGGTAFAWYGLNDYPRLKSVLLTRLAQGGQKAKREFVLRASKAQADYEVDSIPPAGVSFR